LFPVCGVIRGTTRDELHASDLRHHESGTLLLLIYSPGLIDRAIHAPMEVNLAVGILGVFPSALAYLWWAKVLERMDVSTAAPALYLVPPVSMIMASVALNERTPAAVIVGAVIVICSVLLVNLERRITLRKRFLVLGSASEKQQIKHVGDMRSSQSVSAHDL
jgi:hypothetical protein